MAQPQNFPQANFTWDTPQGEDPAKVEPLRVYRDGSHNLSCWRLSAEELAEINRTGRVWLWVMGRHSPVSVTGTDPFTPREVPT